MTDLDISSYAKAHNLRIHKGRNRCNLLQFADGSYQETIGQVETNWTFNSGKRVAVTFEVLENCCSDIILGDSILYDYNVFEDHAASMITFDSKFTIYQLAPFDFIKKWQRKCEAPGNHSSFTRSEGTAVLPTVVRATTYPYQKISFAEI